MEYEGIKLLPFMLFCFWRLASQ